MFARENLIGIDLQTIEPIQKIYDKWGDKFVDKILTDIEKKNAPNPMTAAHAFIAAPAATTTSSAARARG